MLREIFGKQLGLCSPYLYLGKRILSLSGARKGGDSQEGIFTFEGGHREQLACNLNFLSEQLESASIRDGNCWGEGQEGHYRSSKKLVCVCAPQAKILVF